MALALWASFAVLACSLQAGSEHADLPRRERGGTAQSAFASEGEVQGRTE